MGKYYVSFTLPLSTCRVIKADTKEEAEPIAEEMVYDDHLGYWEGIVDDMELDEEFWRRKHVKIKAIATVDDDAMADNE